MFFRRLDFNDGRMHMYTSIYSRSKLATTYIFMRTLIEAQGSAQDPKRVMLMEEGLANAAENETYPTSR